LELRTEGDPAQRGHADREDFRDAQQLPAGTYLWKIRVNPVGMIPENNTSNNTLTMLLTFQQPLRSGR